MTMCDATFARTPIRGPSIAGLNGNATRKKPELFNPAIVGDESLHATDSESGRLTCPACDRLKWPAMPYQKSQLAFDRAQKLMPGGVNSPARAFGGVGGEPIFFARGEGAYLQDLDGNRYIDYIGSWGPMILGHAHPRVIEAIGRAAARGTSFGAPTEAESELAELVIAAIPSIERVRLVS